MSTSDWRLALCGINHKTAGLEQREPLQIGPEDIGRALSTFVTMDGIAEAAIVSTCNRVEFCFVGPTSEEPFEIVARFYREFRDQQIDDLREGFYSHKGKHVAQHLFRVCAGVDSMVLGENQIFGQLKDAYSAACEVRTTGKIIHRVFHQAFRVGKQVRTDTEMGKGACSVSSAAIELLKDEVEKEDRPTILFVGVNRMISLAASNWRKLHHDKLLFANRTVGKANEMARKNKGQGFGLDQLPELLSKSDILFTCTSAEVPIVTGDLLKGAMESRDGRKLIVMDIAIPRDVEVEKDFHDNLRLFDLDDVQKFVAEKQSARQNAVADAEEIIAVRLKEFAYWYDHMKHDFVYNGLSETFEAIKDREFAPIMELLPSKYHKAVEEAAERMARKMANVKLRSTNHKK